MRRWAYRQLKPDGPPGLPGCLEIIAGLLVAGLIVAALMGK